MKKIIQGVPYYSFRDIAKQSGVNERTLRRWVSNGDLDHFIYEYRDDNGSALYRLVPPCECDVLVAGSHNVYHLPREN